jgi:signal transduction histidine kinase
MDNQNKKDKAALENKTLAITFMSVIIILLILITILYSSYASIKSATNKELSSMVSERTYELEKKEQLLTGQNKKLLAYAHLTSHSMRRPLTNILGVINLYDTGENEDISQDQMFDWVKSSAQELDEVIIQSMDVLKDDFDPDSAKRSTGYAKAMKS